MEESWGITGRPQGHRRKPRYCGGQSPESMQRSWWYHGRHQGDTQGARNAAPGVLGHNGSITGLR